MRGTARQPSANRDRHRHDRRVRAGDGQEDRRVIEATHDRASVRIPGQACGTTPRHRTSSTCRRRRRRATTARSPRLRLTATMMIPSTPITVNARTCDHPRSSGLTTTESTHPTVSARSEIPSWFPHVPRRECLTHEHTPTNATSAPWRPRLRPRPGARRHRGRHLRRSGADPVPTRAQRLPAHRPRQGDLRRLRHRRGVRRHLQPALRRHQPRHRRHRVRRRRSSTTSRWLGLRAGRAALRQPTTSSSSTSGPSTSIDARAWPTSTTRTARRSRAQRGGYGKPGVESPYRDRDRSTRTSTCSGACAPASSPTARACCGPRSTCSTRTCSCAIR